MKDDKLLPKLTDSWGMNRVFVDKKIKDEAIEPMNLMEIMGMCVLQSANWSGRIAE